MRTSWSEHQSPRRFAVRRDLALAGIAGLVGCASGVSTKDFVIPSLEAGEPAESGDETAFPSPPIAAADAGLDNDGAAGASTGAEAATPTTPGACDSSCQGCCNAEGACVSGTADDACGIGAALCSNCTIVGGTCGTSGTCSLASAPASDAAAASDGSSTSPSGPSGGACKSGSGSCSHGTCSGCCDSSGNCHPGTSNSNCGTKSQCCVDCSSMN
ncbi:MAG TPA: hypothetical protein VKU41_07025, partial [Polyangiaceae bacterium]|nr:hypothetical protein [Polyangiaceae bacterium]